MAIRDKPSTLDNSRSKRTIFAIMSKPVYTMNPSEPLKKAATLMFDNGIGSVVIVRNRSPIGIITERDIVHTVSKNVDLINHPVEESMSSPAITIDVNESPTTGLRMMSEKKIRRLPVVENGLLVGIVTQRDMVGWFMKNPAVLLGVLTETHPSPDWDTFTSMLAEEEFRFTKK